MGSAATTGSTPRPSASKTGEQTLVGRGNEDGAQMFRQWFADLSTAAEQGRGGAYVFVMGSMAEVLNCFDFPLVFPEINSLQTAVRKVAHEYLSEAEDYGYSPDICGYVKADVAMHIRNGQHSMGKLPKPAISVLTNACNTYIKWAEIWERFYKTPTFVLDVPGTRQEGQSTQRGDRDFDNDKKYVAYQIKELIALCEKVSGKKFDIDRLRETMRLTNVISRGWKRVLETNKSAPSPFNALMDGTVYLGVLNAFRGTPEGAKYFENLVEEMEYKSANAIGTLQDEKYRLFFVGVPCYPIFRKFSELFTAWGGNFVSSTYLWFAAGGTNRGFEYDLKNPLESLAEGTLISVRDAMDSMFFQGQTIADMIEPYRVDGVVFHPIKSCRTTSAGMVDNRRALMAKCDVPSLLIESDMMDKRVVAEAQLKNRIDAFFEAINARRLVAGRK